MEPPVRVARMSGDGVEVRFYIDPDTDEPHIYNHGITESEVLQILNHPGEDLPAADGARMALGQTSAGRF
jgi:hypothetical protein